MASRLRPRSLDEFVGQEHILGPGRLLRRAIQADRLSSLILYGPPGTGKTTLARVIAHTTSSEFLSLNAVLSGVKEVREAIEVAKRNKEVYGRRTILFVDEVHRWNKAQQDALLPWVENGTVIFIGATTENPFFEVISALVSRSRVFQLKPLNAEELRSIARRALTDPVYGYGKYRVEIEEEALEHLVRVADGDARNLLNALELAVETTPSRFPPDPDEVIRIDRSIAEESIQQRAVLYDKEGDYHYDTISAFIKSLRGSDPDAALYWMARMVRAGEDPHFIFRRMLILASEDVGMADPQALVVVEAAARAFDRVGMPEGQYHLTQAALYLATCPKSNSALGYFDALKAVEEEGIRDVPSHLKDSNRDAVGFGHGQGYKYPHAYREHWVAQNYLPPELRGRVFYQPSSLGHEGKIQEEVLRRREALLAALIEEEDESFTFTPRDKSREEWLGRSFGGGGEILRQVRDTLFKRANLLRHERVFVCGGAVGFLLPEALRRVPEGWVWALAKNREEAEALLALLRFLPEVERPVIVTQGELPDRIEEAVRTSQSKTGGDSPAPLFDAILWYRLFTMPGAPEGKMAGPINGATRATSRAADAQAAGLSFSRKLLLSLLPRLSPVGRVVGIEPLREGSSRIFSTLLSLPGGQGQSNIFPLSTPIQEKLLDAEHAYYQKGSPFLDQAQREAWVSLFKEGELGEWEMEEVTFEEERELPPQRIEEWFRQQFLPVIVSPADQLFGADEVEAVCRWIRAVLPGNRVPWKRRYLVAALRSNL